LIIPKSRLISRLVLLFVLMPFCVVWAQNDKKDLPESRQPVEETDGVFFKMKLASGFKKESVDEAGIYKWKKDGAEIYIVVGEAFIESAETLFKALRKASEANTNIEEVKILKIRGAKAMLSKEKPGTDQKRLRSWRLFVLTDKKIVTVDFTAPAKDFDSFVPAFEESLRSFKIVSKS